MKTQPDYIHKRTLLFLIAATLLAFGWKAPQQAQAAPSTITITKTALEDNPNDDCSLYEALQAAFNGSPYHKCNASPDGVIIQFSGAASGGTIMLPVPGANAEFPSINKNVTIKGPVTIDGGGASKDLHVFRIASGGTLNLVNVTVRNAHTKGGGAAVLDTSFGTLNVTGGSFEDNVADGDGGAINSNGNINILGTSFLSNSARGVNSDQSNNAFTGFGGAIKVSGAGSAKLKIGGSIFTGNSADKGGGAIFYTGSDANIADAVFAGNSIDGTGTGVNAPKGGGAIYTNTDAKLQLTQTHLHGNLAPTSNGGALFNGANSKVTLADSAFNGNIAGSTANKGSGGAIYNQTANVTIQRVAFLTNAAVGGDGGAITNDRGSTAVLANTLFSANAAPDGYGGAVNNITPPNQVKSTMVLSNTTFWANEAISGQGGAINNGPGQMIKVGNTIIDGTDNVNCSGTLLSLGHNLDSGTSCNLTAAGDISGVKPLLEGPSFNGGPLASLLSQKLKGGSPAIDTGDPSICAMALVGNRDQRGMLRPNDGDGNSIATCDMGAFETDTAAAGYGSAPVQPGPINLGSAPFSSGVTKAGFSIFETGNVKLSVSAPDFTGPNAGDFSLASPGIFPLEIADGAPAKDIEIICDPADQGKRNATLTLTTNDAMHTNVSYMLTCTGLPDNVPGFSSTPTVPGPIAFGEVALNTTASVNLNIKEAGTQALVIQSGTIGGPNSADFSTTASFPITIPDGGASVDLPIRCTPTQLGPRTAHLTLKTTDPTQSTITFNITCSGKPKPSPYLIPEQSLQPFLLPNDSSDGAYGVVASPNGKNVYMTSFISNVILGFQLNPDGTPNVNTNPQVLRNNTNGVTGIGGASMLAMTSDGKQVYVAGYNDDSIVTFNRDTQTGALTFAEKRTSATLFDGAYGLAVSADNRFVYLTSAGSGTLIAFSRNTTTGQLTQVDIEAITALDGARDLAISPDGKHVYVTASAAADTGNLVAYERNSSTGKLTYIEAKTECDSGGLCLYINGLEGATDVVVSPDGDHVYVTGKTDHAVTTFKRDASTGIVAYQETLVDGVAGVDGLFSSRGLTINPEGSHIFVAGFSDKAVAVLTRNEENGKLSFLEVIKRGSQSATLPALDGALDMSISPDGKTLYTTAYLDDALVVLKVANPIPVLQGLTPASVIESTGAFQLTVNGSGFIPGAQIRWDGGSYPTSFVNATQLTANIPAGNTAATGTHTISVINPGPGGGIAANTLEFKVTAPGSNPVPTLNILAPQSATAGGAAFPLTVFGNNFVPGAVVRWNGVDHATTFVDKSKLQVTIQAMDIMQPGEAAITVLNPTPGGGVSAALSFVISPPGDNPLPSIASITPDKVVSDPNSATEQTIILKGSNFMGSSQAQFDGDNRKTEFVSSTELKVTLIASDIGMVGPHALVVINPFPGGGASNTVGFTVVPTVGRVFIPLILQ